MIILSGMDLLRLEVQAGAELEGGEVGHEEPSVFLSQSRPALGHLPLCSHVHRTGPFRSVSEIRKKSSL